MSYTAEQLLSLTASFERVTSDSLVKIAKKKDEKKSKTKGKAKFPFWLKNKKTEKSDSKSDSNSAKDKKSDPKSDTKKVKKKSAHYEYLLNKLGQNRIPTMNTPYGGNPGHPTDPNYPGFDMSTPAAPAAPAAPDVAPTAGYSLPINPLTGLPKILEPEAMKVAPHGGKAAPHLKFDPEVQLAQMQLASTGFLTDLGGYGADGKLGPKTRAAALKSGKSIAELAAAYRASHPDVATDKSAEFLAASQRLLTQYQKQFSANQFNSQNIPQARTLLTNMMNDARGFITGMPAGPSTAGLQTLIEHATKWQERFDEMTGNAINRSNPF